MFSRLASIWHNLRHRDRVNRDLDAEVGAVFDILVDEKVKAGQSLEQARRAATLELGRVHSITQRVREERSGAWLDALIKDVQYGARMLRANRGFTAVVVLSLAIGIGANSALFSIANALLLRTLPVTDVDHLYQVQIQSRIPATSRFSYPFFEQLRDGFPVRDGLAAMGRVARMRSRVDRAEIEPANVQLVSGEFFSVLGLQPALGRLLAVGDNRTVSGHPVAVVSHSYWTRRLGGAPAALERTLELNGVRFSVVGVAPAGFTGVWLESPVDVWIPVMMQSDVRYNQNFSASDSDMLKPWVRQQGLRWLELLTRADRADGAEAAALNTVFRADLLKRIDTIKDPAERKLALDQSLTLQSFAHGSSGLRIQFRAPLYALMAMVGLLLLIACANTANLLLARATNRQREMAVRLSIGASRARVMTQLLVESLLLAGLAAVVGLALAPLASELLVRMTIGVDSGPLPFSVGIDRQVLAFTAAIALITGLLFGFAPAWRATDLSLAEALKTGGRGNRSGARMNLSKLLVIAQVALSLLLAAAAGLFARSLGNLVSQPLGYQPHVLWVSINPNIGGYKLEELPALYRTIIERAEALPGVESATVAMCGVMTGCRAAADGLAITGYTPQPGEQIVFQENRVGANYFETVGMTIVRGRGFTEADTAANRRIVVINEAAARRYFKDRDPIGQHFGYDTPTLEIAGVVRDARVNTVREAAAPMAFYPLDTPIYVGSMHVRTSGDPEAIADSLRKALHEAAPQLPVDRIVPISTLVAGTLRQERLVARLTTLLGLLALGLACLGIYGVMSYAVKQRTAELGIRFALGAPRPRVLWMVFRESLWLTVAGVAIGLPLLVAASRAIGGLLFNVTATDPLIIGGAMAVLLIVGATSSYLPSWRASRVDPLVALRQE
ncbi:MAG TPA: ABC transporter permease [Vicinamibacterales bacterium]|nr:ABC transporter permease [Vicinamibacterales bacterium]